MTSENKVVLLLGNSICPQVNIRSGLSYLPNLVPGVVGGFVYTAPLSQLGEAGVEVGGVNLLVNQFPDDAVNARSPDVGSLWIGWGDSDYRSLRPAALRGGFADFGGD